MQRKPDGSFSETLKQKAIEAALSTLGLNSTGLKLVGAGIGGTIEGFNTQWNDGGTGKRLGQHASEFSVRDVPALVAGYIQGLLQGVVSPITDLFSLFVMLEQGRDFAGKLAQSALSGKDGLQPELDAILLSLGEMSAPMLAVLRDMRNNKMATFKALLEFAASQGPILAQMEGMAISVGLSSGKAIAKSFEEPWEKKEKKNNPNSPPGRNRCSGPITSWRAAARPCCPVRGATSATRRAMRSALGWCKSLCWCSRTASAT